MEGAGPSDEERGWLRTVLLSDSDNDSSEEENGDISEAHLTRMLKDHLTRKKYAAKYYKNPEVRLHNLFIY